jgi:CRISPR/Cas system-associated exonuclease Cas4 (RecB family)
MIKWSFSSLKQFVNCPKQYHEVKVLQNFQPKVSQQMQYGTEVHKALEDYTREKKELPQNYKRFKTLVDVLLEIPGDKYIEHKMALSADKRPCEFDSPDYWVRGIADLLIVDNESGTAFVVDYKTGSNRYPDPKQLKLMALMVFAHFPKVELVKGGLLFVVHNSFLPEDYERKKSDKYWADFALDLARLEVSFESGNWLPNPSGLCRWCPVKTCEFNKE